MSKNLTQNIDNQSELQPGLDSKSKAAAWIIGAVVVALLLIWFLPPLAAEVYLSNNIAKFISSDTPEDVSLKANTWQLLSGRFSSFNITGRNLTVGNLLVDSYSMEASKGQIDIFKTLREKDISLKMSPVITLTMDVTVADMAALLGTFYPSLHEMAVTGHEGYLLVTGVAATFEGQKIPIEFKVDLTTSDWSSLKVRAYDLVPLSGIDTLQQTIDELTDIYSVNILFNNTTPPIYINSVVVSETGIEIKSNSALK